MMAVTYTNKQNKMNNNKNAYEIRLEVLQLAHSDLLNTAAWKLDELRKGTPDANGLIFERNVSEAEIDRITPTPEQIIARADELYAFVEGRA
jgi:6-phosphogluconolactonase/glucosamine-6-phosphate isomerase/deaminase